MVAPAPAPAALVATAEELQIALRNGAAHIVITEHLYLKELEADAASAVFSSLSTAGGAASLTSTTVSIRVRTTWLLGTPCFRSALLAVCGLRASLEHNV